jgi:phenylalanyl-tRNA synthetase beta chain
MMPLRELDFYDAKGAVEAALEVIGINEISFLAADVKHLQKGQAATISIGGTLVGHIGRLKQEIASTYKFRQPVYLAEIDLESVLEMPAAAVNYRPLPRFPGVVRDVSFIADRAVTFDALRQAIEDERVEICRDVAFVDVYEGKGVSEDQRSITVRLEYRSDERTLIEDEVEDAHRRIIDAVTDRLGVCLRTS